MTSEIYKETKMLIIAGMNCLAEREGMDEREILMIDNFLRQAKALITDGK